MKHILVSIEAGHPERTRSAIAQAIKVHRDEGAAIHLLMVMPRVSGHVAMFFSTDELLSAQIEWGQDDLRPAQAQLDAAGVPFDSRIRIGRSADVIATQARELHCDRIYFGEEPPDLAQRLFGSIAQQVRRLLQGHGDTQVIGS